MQTSLVLGVLGATAPRDPDMSTASRRRCEGWHWNEPDKSPILFDRLRPDRRVVGRVGRVFGFVWKLAKKTSLGRVLLGHVAFPCSKNPRRGLFFFLFLPRGYDIWVLFQRHGDGVLQAHLRHGLRRKAVNPTTTRLPVTIRLKPSRLTVAKKEEKTSTKKGANDKALCFHKALFLAKKRSFWGSWRWLLLDHFALSAYHS